jgi:hypothetical protein
MPRKFAASWLLHLRWVKDLIALKEKLPKLWLPTQHPGQSNRPVTLELTPIQWSIVIS